MANIESIKQKINQLDAGSFQNLCDSYLYKIGYPNIVSLGGEAGTRKTTPGTPDTYFNTSDGKYIFVEYTTQQQNLFTKIKDDLAKCLDVTKTGITHDKIAEIIYCHTSSNITPAQDYEIKNLCEAVGVKLIVIGIDKIAEDLYLYHHIIARDFLGISISTHQILSIDDFIKDYNSNRMAAPIDTEFLFRDKENASIEEAFKTVDVVVLSGVAGTGKTRLALQYAKNHSDTHNEKLYCIHSNALPIYDDLKLFIDSPGNYFLFIDDANQLSGLQHIVRYTTLKTEGYHVKILITVRDYAFQKVIKDIKEIIAYKSVNISAFTDDEIKDLLKQVLEINNPNYQERIIRIADGNARIAILAGKVACSSNRLDSINDVSQLYDDYYGTFLEGHQLFIDNSLCISAGVVAFLEAIHLDHIDSFLPILQDKGLCRESFIENIRDLHEQEILDVYNDKAVRFSEQCLSNYLLKYVFFDKKLLSLSAMIKVCFRKYKERTISSLNTLLNIFSKEDLLCFVEQEIRILWDELSDENSLDFFEFVKVFFRIHPTKALLILQDKIEQDDQVFLESYDIDTEEGKNYQSVTNDIIEILGGFADATDLPTALDLFFQYYLKRPDLYMQFYHTVNQGFGIKKDSMNYGFYTQICFFEKMKEYSDDWKQESIVVLFLEVVKEFLKVHFTPTEGGRKNAFIMYQIPLMLSDGVEQYRKLIWEYLLTLCRIDRYKEKIRQILNSYGGEISEVSWAVLQFDLTYIQGIVEIAFPANMLSNCFVAENLAQVFTDINTSYESLFSEYFKEEKFLVYRLLKGPDYKEVGYKEHSKLKRTVIHQYISNCDLVTFKKLIDVCNEVDCHDTHITWRVGEGLSMAFDALSIKKDCFVDAVKYYIEKDTPNNLFPYQIIKVLFTILSDTEVFFLIDNGEYKQKNMWLYAYYHELPPELITKEHLQGLYEFLADTSDSTITSSSLRDMDFLEKYCVIDKDAFIKACKIILTKIVYSPFIVKIYFDFLFNHIHNAPKVVVQKFEGNFELLEEIYFIMLSYDNNHDYTGEFLKEIYLVQPSILDKYIANLVSENHGSFRDCQEQYHCFFELDDFLEIYNTIFAELMAHCRFPIISVPLFLESILLPIQNKEDLLKKQDEWIKHCIQNFSNDMMKMHCLFSVISKLNMSRKKEYIWFFLENNQSFEDFKNLPLTPTSGGWSGSAVPMYSARIQFLESLLPNFTGIKWVKHKDYIEMEIAYLKKCLESVQIQEILRG